MGIILNNESSAESASNLMLMSSISLLFESNKCKEETAKKHIRFDNMSKCWKLSYLNSQFNGDTVRELLYGLRATLNDKENYPITITLINTSFKDKLSYIILECIVYYLINYKNKTIHICTDKINLNIKNEGIKYSPLIEFKDNNIYNDIFCGKNVDSNDQHFRKIITYDEYLRNPKELSKQSAEWLAFIEGLQVDDDTSDLLWDAITEVSGNALEHGKSDCLIDIDVTNTEYKKVNSKDGKMYYGLNVVILNFSEVRFYQILKDKLEGESELDERYKKVLEAKKNHKKYFKPGYYTERDFYIIASYQDQISGRVDKNGTGGTGLTKLLKSIQDRADSEFCYMLSGTRALYFRNKYLTHDDNMFVGFNSENDFINKPPKQTNLGVSSTLFPGTAYNLNFAFNKMED